MFTAVVREVKKAHADRKVFLQDSYYEERYKEIILRKSFLGKKFSFNSSPVFDNNPYLSQGWISRNSIVIQRADPKNHYVLEELEDRYLWKDNMHAVETICANYGVAPKSIKPDLFFSDREQENNEKRLKLSGRDYIAIEPNGKTDYFADNRLWFFERWQLLVDQLSESSEIIQVGDGTGSSLENVKDLSSKLTFRETAWVISQSKLFIGTIGGLMHAARAVETKSVILYSGTEKVDMAGYSENVNLIKPVDCSPCGFKIE